MRLIPLIIVYVDVCMATFYKSWSYLDGYSFSGTGVVLRYNTLVECAMICKVSPMCAAFTFSDSGCALLDDISPGLQNSFIEDSTAKTFREVFDQSDGSCEAPFQTDATGKLCYLLMTSSNVYWSEAAQSCNEMKGTLISIETIEKHVLLYQAVNMNRCWWFGGYDFKGDNHHWMWLSGVPINDSIWKNDEPNDPSEQCMEAYDTTMLINDKGCTNAHCSYICERQIYDWS